MKIKKYDSTNGWVQEYPEVNVGAIVVSNPNDASSSTFLRGDGTWAAIEDSGNQFVNITGDTMTGNFTTTSGNNGGIYIGSGGSNITSVTPSSKDIVIQDVSQIRFGSASWDWNSWAGLAFNASTEVLTIGGPASSVFSSNTNPPSIDVNFDGLNTSGLKVNNNTVWHAGNDGSGSGLDADTLDGVQGSSFLRSDAADTATGQITASGKLVVNTNTNTNNFYISRGGSTSQEYTSFGRDDTVTHIHTKNDESSSTVRFRFENTDTESGGGANANDRNINFISDATSARILVDGNTVLTTADEGSGNGLDADTLDNIHASAFVRSDASDTMSGDYRIESGSFASLILDRGTTGSGSIVQFENNNGVIGGIGAYGDDGLQFRTKDGTQMVLNASNNVGIGTTNPGAKLDVLSNAKITSASNSTHSLKLEARNEYLNDTGSSGIFITDGGTSTVSDFSSQGAHLVLETRQSSRNIYFKAGNTTSAQHIMDYNGKVGIGTTSPSDKLHIEGNQIISKATTGGQNQIRFQEAGTTKTQITSNYGDDKFYLYHEGDNVMVIDSSSATTFSGDLTVQGDLTINGTTTTLDTTVSTTDQWTVTNAGTDVATIINQTGTADILDVRDNGTSVFKVKDGGDVEMKTDSKFTVGASTTVNEAKIILDASNAGHPQIGLAENNDASWALGVDDNDNSFKIHGAASSTIPTIGGLATPHLELDTTGNLWIQKRLYFTSNAYMEYNSTNDSIDFFFT